MGGRALRIVGRRALATTRVHVPRFGGDAADHEGIRDARWYGGRTCALVAEWVVVRRERSSLVATQQRNAALCGHM